MTYTVAEAKNKLPELIRKAESGERVVITRRGKPVAELSKPSEEAPRKRKFGILGDKKIVNDPDWWRPQNDLDAWFRGDV